MKKYKYNVYNSKIMSTEKQPQQPHIKTREELTKLFNEYTPHEIQIIEVALSKDEFKEFKEIGSLTTNKILEVYPIIQKNDKVTEDIRQLLHGDIIIEFKSHVDIVTMLKDIYEHVRENIKIYTNLIDPISKNKLEILKLYMEIIKCPEFEDTLNTDITIQLHLLEQLYEYKNLTHSNNSYITKLLLTVKNLKIQIQIFNISNEKDVSTIQTDFNALTAILDKDTVEIEKIEKYYLQIIKYIIEYIKKNRSIFVTNPKTVTVTETHVTLDKYTPREDKPGVFYGKYTPSVESIITNNDLDEFYLKCINFKVLHDGLISLKYAYNAVKKVSTTTQPVTTTSIQTSVDNDDFPDLPPIDDDDDDKKPGGKKKRSSSKKHKKSRKPHRGIKKSRRYKRATRN
jgi:hypothetical protein